MQSTIQDSGVGVGNKRVIDFADDAFLVMAGEPTYVREGKKAIAQADVDDAGLAGAEIGFAGAMILTVEGCHI